jgi:hypothetical protein
MRPGHASRFELGALYAALDEQRQARGLSWSAALREIARTSERKAAHNISLSTLKGLAKSRVAEADGVLQVLLWLRRSPESFVSGHDMQAGNPLPDVPSDKILRFDTQKLHAALANRLKEQSVSWDDIANETGWSVPSLMHLSKGGRTSFPAVMRLCKWLGQPAAQFTRLSDS